MITTTIGYPYIGENREWKRLVEKFWKQAISEDTLQAEWKKLRITHLKKQQKLGLTQVTSGDFTMYDRMLDLAFLFNLIPSRYRSLEDEPSLTTYYAMARGTTDTVACEMTKWFNTNYHYIVPEYEGATLKLNHNHYVDWFLEAKEAVDIDVKPTLIGPMTFSKLTKGYRDKELAHYLLELLPLYAQVLQQLVDVGAEWIQLEEPILTTALSEEDCRLAEVIYTQLVEAVPQAKVMLTTYFEALTDFERITNLPVAGIGLDLIHGKKENLAALRQHGFPAQKTLALGVVNGRDIWASNLQEVAQDVQAVQTLVSPQAIWLQPSCSLQHCPVTVANETTLFDTLKDALAFSDEKLGELVEVSGYIESGEWPTPTAVSASMKRIEALKNHASRQNESVSIALAKLEEKDFKRTVPFTERLALQQRALHLPLFPTTTIGSFPQSKEVRSWRAAWRRGDLDNAAYEAKLDAETLRWIALQEEIDLDVLVHGEFERTDMVEYFGEKLAGFAFTKFAWVVSYGSRCVKPPIIYGDVDWLAPMTVKETVFAQQHTDKWMKGMLTGPVTILNWSFVRNDLPRDVVAAQIALALRKEIHALEEAGIRIIQVDEPALREGLPLRQDNWQAYLNWAIDAFKLATSSVDTTTQIHTHMCYCEFNDFIDPITALDADVISLETSRSHGELIHSLKENPYPYGIGLGVYDIHSPRVPSADEMTTILEESLAVIPANHFWVNPDCGLKTRQEPETVASLKHMVEAAKALRKKTLQTN